MRQCQTPGCYGGGEPYLIQFSAKTRLVCLCPAHGLPVRYAADLGEAVHRDTLRTRPTSPARMAAMIIDEADEDMMG